MEINHGIEAAPQKHGSRRPFASGLKNFVKIGIAVETNCKPRFHEHGNPKTREFFFQGADRSREQQAISHRTETDKKDAGGRRKAVEQLFSLQLSLR